jgi:hypothetical protein
MSGNNLMDNNHDALEDGTAQDGFVQDEQDPMLQAVLKDFRASAHHWSEAIYQTRSAAALGGKSLVLSLTPRRSFSQRSLAWALSLVVAAGVVSTGGYQFHQRDLARQAAAQRQAEYQRQLALEQHAREADELLAKVDSDLSREVPSAMEPLASLMVDDNTQ